MYETTIVRKTPSGDLVAVHPTTLAERVRYTAPLSNASITVKDALDNIIYQCITPRMFGAKADGETDDFEAFSSMLNTFDGNTVFDLEGKTYYIKGQLNLKSGYTFRNGNLIFGTPNTDETRNTAITCIYAHLSRTSRISNIRIENIKIDGDGKAEEGIHIAFGDNIIIRDCEISNMISKEVQRISSYGILLSNCTDSTIENCYIHDIEAQDNWGVADSDQLTGVARGIAVGRSYDTIINNCIVENIIGHRDGSCIHTNDADSTNYIEPYGNNIIRNSYLSNGTHRCIKIQQKGTIVKGCKLVSDDEPIYKTNNENDTLNRYCCRQSAIAIYDSDTTIEECSIDVSTPVPITVGVNNSETHYCNNVIIKRNQIRHKGFSYQGAITFSGRVSLAENIVIDNNIIYCDNMTTEPAVLMRGRFNNVTISSNTCKSLHGVLIQKLYETEKWIAEKYSQDSSVKFENTYQGLTISDNNFTTNNVSVCIHNEAAIHPDTKEETGYTLPVQNLTVLGNICTQIKRSDQKDWNGYAKNSVAKIEGSNYTSLDPLYNIENNFVNEGFNDGLNKSS